MSKGNGNIRDMGDGHIMGIIFSKIADVFFSLFLSSKIGTVKDKMLNSSSFARIIGSIKFDSSDNDTNKIVKDAFDDSKKSRYFKNIDNDGLRLLVSDNKDVINDWIVGDSNFNSNLLKFQNDEHKKKHYAFMRSIYKFIKTHKNEYLSISTRRIESKIDAVQVQNDNVINKVDEIKTKLEWSFSKELNEIEDKIKKRDFKDAISNLRFIETKIIQSRNDDEIEKFYQLYSNVYLMDFENQSKALPYIKELISYTKDSFLKWYRSALYSLIDKNLDDVKNLLTEQNLENLNTGEKRLFLKIKINYLMITQRFSDLETFLNFQKDFIENYLIWCVKLYLYQGLYEKAVQQITLLKDSEISDFQDKVTVLSVKVFWAVTKIQEQGYSDEILRTLNVTLCDIKNEFNIVSEDVSSKKTLLMLKGMILQNIHREHEAYVAYQQIEALGGSDNPNFLRNYAIILVFERNYEKSFEYIKKTLDIIPNDVLCLEMYFSVLCELNPARAENELLTFNETEETLGIKLKLIFALIKQNKIKSAEEKLNEFETKYPNNAKVLFEKGEFAYFKKNCEDAFKFFKAFASCNPEIKTLLYAEKRLLQIGLSEWNLGYLADALSIIGDITYPHLSDMGYEIIYALILHGNIEQAHSLVKRMRTYDLITKDILRLDMSCYFYSRNYEKAIEIYNQLKEQNAILSEDQKLYLFSLYYLGRRDLLLEAIDIMPEPTSPDELIAQSQTIRNLGVFEKAIKLARDGYRKYPNNQGIMENFIQMVLMRNYDQIDDDIINDFCVCRDSYFANPNDNQNFKMLKIPTDAKGEDILKILEDNLPRQNKIDYLKFLDTNYLHISILSHKFNYFFMWKNIIELPQYKIYISDCSIMDLRNQYGRITENAVIIDLPSLITCAYLDILQYVALYFEQICISQDSIEILEKVKNSKNNISAESYDASLYQLNNYSYPKYRIDYSDLDNYIERIDIFRECNNVHVVGQQLEPTHRPPQKLIEFFQKTKLLESNDILYACSSDMQIMLESYVNRVAVKTLEPNVCCFEVETLLMKLLNQNKISEECYFESIFKLLKAKYYCIFFNESFLIYYMKKNNYSNSEETDFLKNLFVSAAYKKDWTAIVLVNFIVTVSLIETNDENAIRFSLEWVNSIMKERKEFSDKERYLLFSNLYNATMDESIRQIIYSIIEGYETK